MSQVILIHKDDEAQQLLEINLELYVGATVIPMPRSAKAIELLAKLPRADLIICQNEIGHEASALDIYKYIKKYERNIPILTVGHNRLLAKKTYMTKETNDWQAVIRASAKILGISAQDLAKRVVPDFYPLNLKYFQSVTTVGTDVYIRIPKGKGKKDFQYIKRFPANEKYDQEIIEKYKKYGVEFLYVPKDKRLLFAEYFTDQIVAKLKLKEADLEEKVTATSDAYYAFHDQLKATGLTEKSIMLAEATITSMEESITQVNGLKKLLSMLKKNEGNFLFNHSLMIGYIGHHVLNHLLMGTKEQQKNFVFTAFFHDITLKDNEYAKIHHESEIENFKLDHNDKTNVMDHALMACNILKEYPQVPMAAPLTIKQHHCTLDGRGFIDFPGDRITPSAQVFKVVEDFVMYVFLYRLEFNRAIEKLQDKYTKYTYKEVVDVLEKLQVDIC